MDAAPRAIRPYILVTTFFLVVGTGAIVLLWMLAFSSGPAGIALPDGPAEAEVQPVEFPADVAAAEQERLRALGGRMLDAGRAFDPAEAARLQETMSDLVAAGRHALPVMLTAMASLASDERALAAQDGRLRFARIDDVLIEIRERLTPRERGSAFDWTAATLEEYRRRARRWFGWHARLQAARPG